MSAIPPSPKRNLDQWVPLICFGFTALAAVIIKVLQNAGGSVFYSDWAGTVGGFGFFVLLAGLLITFFLTSMRILGSLGNPNRFTAINTVVLIATLAGSVWTFLQFLIPLG